MVESPSLIFKNCCRLDKKRVERRENSNPFLSTFIKISLHTSPGLDVKLHPGALLWHSS